MGKLGRQVLKTMMCGLQFRKNGPGWHFGSLEKRLKNLPRVKTLPGHVPGRREGREGGGEGEEGEEEGQVMSHCQADLINYSQAPL